jgi:hypothetical protein
MNQDYIHVEDPLDVAPPPIPIEPYVTSRRLYTHEPPGPDDDILIIDSAADISCVGRGFSVMFYSGEKMTLNTALVRSPSNTFEIVSATAVIEDKTTSRQVIIIINQAIYVPDLEQHESLLHTDQARNHNVYVNDIATCFCDREGNPGRQNIEAEGCIIPLKHDGRKYFVNIREPKQEDWETCQIIELTSPESWNQTVTTRRRRRIDNLTEDEVKEWSYRLGRLNLETTKYTLAATTQLVQSVEAESRVIQPKRLTEGFSSDTFFPNERSSRGYTCAQVFVGVRSGYTYVIPLKNKVYAYTALQDFIRYVGAPSFIAVDAAKEENLGEWQAVCRTHCIPQRTSEPNYQNQNRVERRIQDIKR